MDARDPARGSLDPDPDPDPEPDPELEAGNGGRPPASRSLVVPVLVGITATAIMFLIVASLFTIPLFALARFTEPGKGTGREWFRDGLRWAALAGAVVAASGGAALGVWLRRGGRLPDATKPWEVE